MTYHAPPDVPDTASPTTDIWAANLGVLLALEITIFLILIPAVYQLPDPLGHNLGETLLISSVVAAWTFIPVFMYRDMATTTHTKWPVYRRTYLGALLLCPPLVGVYYLYRRYYHFGTPAIPFGHVLRPTDGQHPPSNWWVVVGLAVISDLVFILFMILFFINAPAMIRHPLLALVTTLFGFRFVLLPVALYKDASAVQQVTDEWHPRPILLAIGGWCLCLVICPYYLTRRAALIPGSKIADPFSRILQTTR